MLLNNGALVGQGVSGGASIGSPTFFGISMNIADTGSYTTPSTVVLTPVSSMVAGDLVYFYGLHYDSSATENMTISADGGQSWTSAGALINAVTDLRVKAYWCRFDGTWDTSPSMAMVGSDNGRMAGMMVFRPTTGSNTWAVDQAQAYTNIGTPVGGVVTLPAVTNAQTSTVTIGLYYLLTTKVFAAVSGTGWVGAGDTQYRNLADTDRTMSFVYKLGGSGSTGDVGREINFSPNVYGHTISFYESI